MRCFVAIEIPGTVRESIRGTIESIRHTARGIKWVPVENIHITLKFLGEVSEEIAREIGKRLSPLSASHGAFTITIRGTGVFPSFKRPSVLWIGVDKSEEMEKLYQAIEGSLSELGFPREDRKFSPHLTFGRVRDTRDIEYTLKELNTFRETVFGTIKVEEVLLMKSVLKPTGAEYSRISVFGLNRGGT